MNNLSWMLYLAGIIPNLGGFVIFLAVMLSIATVAGVVCGSVASADAQLNKANYGEKDKDYIYLNQWVLTWRRVVKWAAPFAVVFALAGTMIPDRQTIQLILASELGETVVQNEDVQEIFSLLKQRLRDELTGGDE